MNLKRFFLKYDETSLKSKLISYFTIYYIPLILFLLIIMILSFNLLIIIKRETLIKIIIFDLIIFFMVYFISLKIISKIIEEILIRRLDLIKKDFEEIKLGNKVKKIELEGIDEIDKILYDVNKIFNNLNDLIKLEKEQSFYDPLTKAYNRRALKINFKTLIEKIKRSGENIYLLMFDLDNFKKINDTYGHNIGDKVLINIVKILKNFLRKYDYIYRIGGEEFVIILNKSENFNLDLILKRIRFEITNELKKEIPEIKEDITISGGVVSSRNFNLENKDILNEMLKIADEKLYLAKKSGKNKILIN